MLVFAIVMLIVSSGMGAIQGRQPHAIVHIGPHKTASSYIQSSLYRLSEELMTSNFYWPTYADETVMGPKDIALYGIALWEGRPQADIEIQKMIKFLQQSLHLKRNIILSAEAFSLMESGQIALLKQHLKGFNTTIVFVYRDVLSQMISLHFEDSRFETSYVNFSVSFATYMLSKLDNIPITLQPMTILDRFASVFGQQQMRIIDLAGTVAAGRDIAHVIACEAMGILCSHVDLFHQKDAFRNPSYSLIPAQIFSVYKTYVLQHKHSFCGPLLDEYHYFDSRYFNHTNMHSPPAIITSQLIPLRPFAEQIDRDLRAKYGAQIILANQTATLESMRRAQVTELQLELFLQDMEWHDWIKEEYKVARASGRICHGNSVPVRNTS